MAKRGEIQIRETLEYRDYKIEKISTEDIHAIKDNLSIIIDDKDWKDKVEVFKNNIYQTAINNKKYKKDRHQVVNYAMDLVESNKKNGIFRNIVCVYVL